MVKLKTTKINYTKCVCVCVQCHYILYLYTVCGYAVHLYTVCGNAVRVVRGLCLVLANKFAAGPRNPGRAQGVRFEFGAVN